MKPWMHDHNEWEKLINEVRDVRLEQERKHLEQEAADAERQMNNNPTQPDIVALINEVVRLNDSVNAPDRQRELMIALHVLLSPEQYGRLTDQLLRADRIRQNGFPRG